MEKVGAAKLATYREVFDKYAKSQTAGNKTIQLDFKTGRAEGESQKTLSTGRRIANFTVGKNVPYYNDGWRTVTFDLDKNGEILGIYGYGKEYYKKVQKFSKDTYIPVLPKNV
jgi:hypothetical protein